MKTNQQKLREIQNLNQMSMMGCSMIVYGVIFIVALFILGAMVLALFGKA